jgi:hypothetical protein
VKSGILGRRSVFVLVPLGAGGIVVVLALPLLLLLSAAFVLLGHDGGAVEDLRG